MTSIDFSKLPPPDVIEDLCFEEIVTRIRDRFAADNPDLAEVLDLESEPLTKLMESAAYELLLTRQRVNDAGRAVMVAYAQHTDLDNLAALFGVERLLIKDGDPEAVPPRPPEYESDERLRQRLQESLEGFSTAGPEGAYHFHALSADARVKDVSVIGPPDVPDGEVHVLVLSTEDEGYPSQEILDNVEAALNADTVRPLTDKLSVFPAGIFGYSIDATLIFLPGPDPAVVMEEARKAIEAFVEAQHRMAHDITISAIHSALHQEGVQDVQLLQPPGSIHLTKTQAPYCISITLRNGGTDI